MAILFHLQVSLENLWVHIKPCPRCRAPTEKKGNCLPLILFLSFSSSSSSSLPLYLFPVVLPSSISSFPYFCMLVITVTVCTVNNPSLSRWLHAYNVQHAKLQTRVVLDLWHPLEQTVPVHTLVWRTLPLSQPKLTHSSIIVFTLSSSNWCSMSVAVCEVGCGVQKKRFTFSDRPGNKARFAGSAEGR